MRKRRPAEVFTPQPARSLPLIKQRPFVLDGKPTRSPSQGGRDLDEEVEMPRRGATGTSMQRHRLRPRRAQKSTQKSIADRFDRFPFSPGETVKVRDWIADSRGYGRVLHVEADRVWIMDRWIARSAILWRYIRKPKSKT
jgi:hypothetical protein